MGFPARIFQFLSVSFGFFPFLSVPFFFIFDLCEQD